MKRPGPERAAQRRLYCIAIRGHSKVRGTFGHWFQKAAFAFWFFWGGDFILCFLCFLPPQESCRSVEHCYTIGTFIYTWNIRQKLSHLILISPSAPRILTLGQKGKREALDVLLRQRFRFRAALQQQEAMRKLRAEKTHRGKIKRSIKFYWRLPHSAHTNWVCIYRPQVPNKTRLCSRSPSWLKRGTGREGREGDGGGREKEVR